MTEDNDAPALAQPINEITAAAHEAKRCREGATGTTEPGKQRDWPASKIAVGIGIGVGSAALAAALLYAKSERDRR